MELAVSLRAALVIEHQVLAQSHIKYTLHNLGFKVVKFADRSSAAIKALHKEKFDLILCAYDLNQGADGYQLFERIIKEKLLLAQTSFVFMSSENDLPLSQSIIELKPDDFILKPFTAKQLELRLRRVLTKKLLYRPIFEALDQQNLNLALTRLEQEISENKKPRLMPYLLKLKGEVLQAQGQWQTGEQFYQKVLSIKEYVWANIGLVNCFFHLGKIKQAKEKLKFLVTSPDSRLAALDILTSISKNNKEFEQAIKYLKSSTEIAPRNVERQKEVVAIARITYDFESQFEASNKIVDNIKNSIHDTPDVYLSAVRSTIDYGLTAFNNDEVQQLSNIGESILRELKKQFPDIPLNDQIQVATARIYNLKNDSESAKKLIKENIEQTHPFVVHNLEDSLDKAKAFHELGFHNDSQKLFEQIAIACEEFPSDEIFQSYIEKEKKLRIEIKDPPKILNNKAVKLYSSGNYSAALKAFLSAFKVMPKNPSIALNLLQTVVDGRHMERNKKEALEIILRCKSVLEFAKLNDEQQQRYKVYLEKLALD